MPERGSLQDRIACEMLARERRRELQGQIYLGRILAASLNLPEKVFSLWTKLYSMEVFQTNYSPDVVEDKVNALTHMEERETKSIIERNDIMKKLDKLTSRPENERPLTEQEVEELKRKLRKRHVRTRPIKK